MNFSYFHKFAKINNLLTEYKNNKFEIDKEVDEDINEEIDLEEIPPEPKRKKIKHSEDDSWTDPKHKPIKGKKKADNKVKINLNEVGIRQKPKEAEKPIEIIAEKPKPQLQPQPQPQLQPQSDNQFRFNLTDNKHMQFPSMNQPSPAPIKRDQVSFNANSFGHPDTISGTPDHGFSGGYMYKPFAFSPSPFAQNRSPGVSPNMMPMYSPMMFRQNENFRGDYQNRNMGNIPQSSGLMRQGETPNINRQDTPLLWDDKLGGGMYPSQNKPPEPYPMFSPGGGMDNQNYFNPSPNICNFSSSSFGYRRTPFQNYARTGPVFQGVGNPINNPQGANQRNQQNDSDRIFELNPFGN